MDELVDLALLGLVVTGDRVNPAWTTREAIPRRYVESAREALLKDLRAWQLRYHPLLLRLLDPARNAMGTACSSFGDTHIPPNDIAVCRPMELVPLLRALYRGEDLPAMLLAPSWHPDPALTKLPFWMEQ